MYHPPSYNIHTLKGPPNPTPNHRMYHPPSYNTHTLKGPPPPAPLPPTTGCTTHNLTTHTPTILQHSYTKGSPTPTPCPPTPNHRMYHPPSYNTHTLKGPPPPPPSPLPTTTGCTTHHLTTHTPTILQHSYTKGTPTPTPCPPTPNHRMYHPPSYNSYTHNLTTLIH